MAESLVRSSSYKRQPGQTAWAVGVLALLGVSVAVVVWLIALSNRGLDFIDEGFYLNWISTPWLYDFSVSQFGFVYHALYTLMGNDLVALRRANVVLTYILGWGLAWIMLRQPCNSGGKQPLDLLGRIAVSSAFATTALFILIRTDGWIPTPYYNTLGFQGAILVACGLVLGDATRTVCRDSGWVLVGIGGCVVFLAKPTSAGLLALLFVAYMALMPRHFARGLLIASATSITLLMIFAWGIDGSLLRFVHRLQDGVTAVQLFDAGHSVSWLEMFRVDELHFSLTAMVKLACFSALFGVLTYRLFQTPTYTVRMPLDSAAHYLVIGLSIGAIAVLYQPKFFFHNFYLLSTLSVLLGVMAGLLLVSIQNKGWVTRRRSITQATVLVVLPYILAYGSNNNYWQLSSSASFFWIAAALCLLVASGPWRGGWRMLLMAAVVQLGAIALLWTSHQVPYNQLVSLRHLNAPLTLPQAESKIYIRRDIQRYLKQVSYEAARMGFAPGTPMIDMTGHYGTVMYYLKGQAIGLPIMFGGYPGSADIAAYGLDRVSCRDLARSWLLVEHQGYRSLPESMLMRYGIEVNRDFLGSGHIRSIINPPNSNWPGMTHRIYLHQILKPIRDVNKAEQACEVARRGG